MLGEAVVLLIAGNKIDLTDSVAIAPDQKRAISKEEAQEYANSMGALFHECSAKGNRGIRELFDDLTKSDSFIQITVFSF